MEINLFIQGSPVQQGSMKAFAFRRKTGGLGVSMTHSKGNALIQWRENIRTALIGAYPELIGEEAYFKQYAPVEIECIFYLKKSKSNKLPMPTNKMADLDKLIRAVGDALSGVVYYDDCQTVSIKAEKRWATEEQPEGLLLRVRGVQ